MNTGQERKPRYLITGASSFSAGHLARHLRLHSDGVIIGCSRSEKDLAPEFDEWHPCDVRDPGRVSNVVALARPSAVFHLAGSTDAADPDDLIRTNILGTWNLLSACGTCCDRMPRVLIVGSAAEFGEMRPDEDGLAETRTPTPSGLYGYSRHATLEIGRLAHRQWGLEIYGCRPFNMIGPGLPEKYAPSKILKRMREAIESGNDVFSVVNGNAVRDFIDVRDVARAWTLIITKGTPGVPYSLGVGQGVAIQTIAEIFADLLGTSMRIHDAESGDSNGRSDCTRSIADPTRLLLDTGFSPLIPLKESLRDMLHPLSLPLRTPNNHL